MLWGIHVPPSYLKINAQKNTQELFTAEADLSKVIYTSIAPETL